MDNLSGLQALDKIPTGIEGFEHITMGGLTEGRTTLVVGSSGSGKTLLAVEFLYRGITQFDSPGVFVTFEERVPDIVRNVKRLGWNLGELVEQGKLMFIDASPEPIPMEKTGPYDLSGLIAQIGYAIDEVGAKLLVMDSIGSLFHQFTDSALIRREIFRDSILLLSGPTGGGKTLMCTTFAAEACRNGEKVLLLAYEESRAQLLRNAQSWGMDFQKWEREGLLNIICHYPETMGLEDHLLMIRREIERFKPQRLVLDSVSAMERISNVRNFREFVIGLTSYVKQERICSLLTSTTPQLSGGESVTEAHISTITDVIILLRYVEINGILRRGIAVIKMRGSQHEKQIREFTIDSEGMHIGEPFKNVQNIILGIPSSSGPSESDQLGEMFEK